MANVIGDIAGNFKTLMALLEKMPDDEVISVGDMVDRGPRSKEVLKWFMENGRAIMGNHEHMMLDHMTDGGFYERGLWLYNGGTATLESFGYVPFLPEDMMKWVRRLPYYLEVDGFLVSHSFIHPEHDLKSACKLGLTAHDNPNCIFWSRRAPVRREGYVRQIAGHNSQWGLKRFSDEEGEYAICIDSCRANVMTGIHLPSMEIYQQEFID